MNVIALRVAAVATNPGSNVNRPVSRLSRPMSMAGSPSVPRTSGKDALLLVEGSVICTDLSDTAVLLRRRSRERERRHRASRKRWESDFADRSAAKQRLWHDAVPHGPADHGRRARKRKTPAK